jgi:hypothetical protein
MEGWKNGRVEGWKGWKGGQRETGYGRAGSPSRPQTGLSSRNTAARDRSLSRSGTAINALTRRGIVPSFPVAGIDVARHHSRGVCGMSFPRELIKS